MNNFLSQADLQQFEEKGFLKVSACVPSATRVRDVIWEDLKTRFDIGDEIQSWHGQYVNFPAESIYGLKLMPTERMSQALNDLFKGRDWTSDHLHKRCGTVFATLPRAEKNDIWSMSGEWHWDMGENHHLPSYNGVLVCNLLTDANHQGGGTLFVSGSHHSVAAHYHRTRGQFSDNYSAKRMQSFFHTEEWFRNLDSGSVPKGDQVATYMDKISTVNGIELRVHEMTGQSGDTYFLHPLLVHAGSPNGSSAPRLMHRAFARRVLT